MERDQIRVGLIGYGTIGQEVVQLIKEHAENKVVIVGALVRNATKVRPPGPVLSTTLPDLLAQQPQIIVEVAGHEGLRAYGSAVLCAGLDLLVVSAGVLADPEVHAELLNAARIGRAQARVVSGGVGGLDALSAASLGGLTSVLHTIRRPPETFLTPEELPHDNTVREVFRGTARQAVLRYPQSLNVAATVALAGVGFDQTEVRVLADPTVPYSRHDIHAEGTFGIFHMEIENAKKASHQGTRLVTMSIVHALLQHRTAFIIG